MGFPNKVTVGTLLTFLDNELRKGTVDEDTPIFLELYSLKEESSEPKETIPDATLNFDLRVWEREGTVAFTGYLSPKNNSLFFKRICSDGKSHEKEEA